MTDKDDLAARVALRCILLGYNLKPSHVGSLAGHIRQSITHRGVIADSDIDALLPTLKKQYQNHFIVDANLTAVQKLEKANEQLAKREETNKPDGTIPLTDEERRRLKKLSPAQRLDFASDRTAKLAKAGTK